MVDVMADIAAARGKAVVARIAALLAEVPKGAKAKRVWISKGDVAAVQSHLNAKAAPTTLSGLTVEIHPVADPLVIYETF